MDTQKLEQMPPIESEHTKFRDKVEGLFAGKETIFDTEEGDSADVLTSIEEKTLVWPTTKGPRLFAIMALTDIYKEMLKEKPNEPVVAKKMEELKEYLYPSKETGA